MCKNVPGSYMPRSPKLETTQMSTNNRMDKNIVHAVKNEIFHSNKKGWTIAAHSLEASERQYRGKEATHKGDTQCESLYRSSEISKTHLWW